MALTWRAGRSSRRRGWTTGTLRNHVDRSFLAGLVALFAFEDSRERDRLKYVYHQLYSKLTVERAFMQRIMAAALLRFVYDTSPEEAERHCGVGELLEICGSIINGFAVPLKEEHRAFMARVLLPLHRTRWVHTYHRQLSYCGSIRRSRHLPPPLAGDQMPEGGAAHRRARGDRRDPLSAPGLPAASAAAAHRCC
uniref:Transposon protein, putative, unclassified n=1 Tax=Oryza sativa subsp. japonica TaxID=39947 RepID=Q109B4_ORYSJ|nr:transposon protein, putative, unclassified [Oryza sativa Japonica Group]